MKIARITGTVTATAKDAALVGHKLLVCDVDTVGSGVGDQVLISTGSAARLPNQTTGAPVDAVIVAIIDTVDLG